MSQVRLVPLPSATKLRVRLVLLDVVLAFAALSVMILYLNALIDMSAEEWRSFAIVTCTYAVLVAGGFEPIRRRLQAPVLRFLQADADDLSPEEARDAFRAVIFLPAAMQRFLLFAWTAAVAVIPVGLSALGHGGWGPGFRLGVLVAAGISGAGICAAVSFFLCKRELTSVREAIAARVPDPEDRRALIHRMPLARKLQVAICGSVLSALIFAMALTWSKAGDVIDARALAWQQRVLEAIAPRLEQGSLDSALRKSFPQPELLPYRAEFSLVDPAGEDAGALPEALLATPAGGHEVRQEGGLVAWRGLRDGRVLLAALPREELRGGFAVLGLWLGAVCVVATVLVLCIVQLFVLDLRRATRVLGSAAERMAGGDLRQGRVLESEDEMGDLARSFERMGNALRATVGRVGEAADRVDAAAAQIAGVSESVASASSEQVSGIEEAKRLMERINEQVGGVANSARALNVSVEESSSSILELGAAGEELNDTASVLSSKVDEVSTSIEQMVRSVKQVRAVSDGLGEAASDTSSSMEEMASAMRAVDNTAEMTADLSRTVVQSAESGQAKVSQTIEGMQAIRDATDSAETVIRGLGLRTSEIGAILDVIDDVADETNLLALNAAIIAAQAGEHGRGFSVVAEQIKELADRVLASTKEIGGLIRSVQDESGKAVSAIEDGSQSVASGVDLSAAAGLSLEEITRSARESGSHIGAIVSAVQEQTKAAAHVVELMDRVRDGVDQIAAAGAEQDRGNDTVYRSAVTMSEVAQQVRRTTEEQARGFGRIRESVEGVRDAVEQINGSLQEQSAACAQVTTFLEQVFDRTRGNEEAARRMGQAMRSLAAQAEVLRDDVARFQI